jgi:hypothetical protein
MAAVASVRVWSEEDEVRILEGLAAGHAAPTLLYPDL